MKKGEQFGPCIHRSSAFVPKLNIVEETPSEELRNKNHIMAAPAQVMYIMADLGPKDRLVAQSLTDLPVILQVMSAVPVTDILYAIQNFLLYCISLLLFRKIYM